MSRLPNERSLERGIRRARACPTAPPAPIGVDELTQAARPHGITLRLDRRCIAPGVVAQASNIVNETTPDQQAQISAEDGEITCLLRAEPQRAGDVVEDKATVTTRFRYLNATCMIVPVPDTNERQVDRLRAVFADLRRARGR